MMMLSKCLCGKAIAVVFLITIGCASALGALVPPYFVNAVVALGGDQSVQDPDGKGHVRWVTEGTGFLYGYLVQNDSDLAKRQYAVFLITAGHVLKEHITSGEQSIHVRLDALEFSSASQELEIPISNWFFHPNPNVDLAAMPVPITFLRDHGLQSAFFPNDEGAVTKDQLRELGVSAGDGVFILGFPLNLTGEQRNYVIVRQGAIARIQELLENASTSFLVDLFVFPGNSGGPVVLRPEIVAIQGTKANSKALLTGVVISYQAYTEVAVSMQTKRPRVAFEENSGLAVVLPIDDVNDMVRPKAEEFWKSNNQATGAEPQ